MILPDVNLLVYAYNAADPRHERAREWWETSVNGKVPVALAWITVTGFIRLMTHPRFLVNPMTVPDTTRRVRNWLDHPNLIVIEPGQRFAQLFLRAIEDVGTAGNLTTDAHLAALAIEHQAELHSNDVDFARFSGLRWKNPLK
jgi:toxin-antitoxin system PIN domain toxin